MPQNGDHVSQAQLDEVAGQVAQIPSTPDSRKVTPRARTITMPTIKWLISTKASAPASTVSTAIEVVSGAPCPTQAIKIHWAANPG